MRNVKVVIGMVIILFLAGCASSSPKPTFNINDRKIVRIGKSVYYIPKNTSYEKFPDKWWLKKYQSFGLKHCRMGDVLWRSYHTNKLVDAATKGGMTTEDEKLKYFFTMVGITKSGWMDCEHPLTPKEKAYHRKRIDRQLSNINAQLEYYQREKLIRALNKPIRHEVYHTGNVQHNVEVTGSVYHY